MRASPTAATSARSCSCSAARAAASCPPLLLLGQLLVDRHDLGGVDRAERRAAVLERHLLLLGRELRPALLAAIADLLQGVRFEVHALDVTLGALALHEVGACPKPGRGPRFGPASPGSAPRRHGEDGHGAARRDGPGQATSNAADGILAASDLPPLRGHDTEARVAGATRLPGLARRGTPWPG